MVEILTLREVAARLRVHPSTIYRLIQRGELPHFRVGIDYRFDTDAIERWMASKEQQCNHQSESKSSARRLRSVKK